jgi:hypothetical protein
MNDLIFQKYEKFSVYYIIRIDQLENFIRGAQENNPDLSYQDLNDMLDQYIEEHCYYNLLTHFTNEFDEKLKHNIKLARDYTDNAYLDYVKHKFDIEDDLSQVDLTLWNYKSNKIKIKLKINSQQQLTKTGTQYGIKTLLADFLEIPSNQTFKYKSDIIRLVHKYIYENQLQNYENKNVIIPDEHLTSLLLPLNDQDTSYTYENLPSYLKHLIRQI